MNERLPYNEFVRTNFPELWEAWKLSEEEWARLFGWYIGKANSFTFYRGLDIIGFVLFRPLNKDQLGNRNGTFEFDENGEYLYIPAFVTSKRYKGRGLWNLMKGMAAYAYPNIKFIAYENFKDPKHELNIIPVPAKILRKKEEEEKRVRSSSARHTTG